MVRVPLALVAFVLAALGLARPALAQAFDPADVVPTVDGVYYDLAVESWQADFGYINPNDLGVIFRDRPENWVDSNDPNLPYRLRGDGVLALNPAVFESGTFTDVFRVPFGTDFFVTWNIDPNAVTAVPGDGIASVVRPTTLLRPDADEDGFVELNPADTYTHTAASNPLPLPMLEVWDGGTLNVAADLTADVAVVQGGGKANVIGGAFTVDTYLVVDTGGELRAFGGTIETNLAQIEAGGRLVASGGVQDFGFGLTNFGETVLIDTTINGDVINRPGSATNIVGEVVFTDNVSGPGAFFGSGTATFNGGFAPGASPAEVAVEGNIALGDGNILEIELGGILPGEFDALLVQGDVSLDGTLDLTLLSGYTPLPGQAFEILDVGGTLTGTFIGLSEGDIAGTFDGIDLLISYRGGDGNDVFLSAVPEPTTGGLALLGFGCLMLGRRRGR